MTRLALLLLVLCSYGPLAARTAPRDQFYGSNMRTILNVEDKQTQDPLIGATVQIACGADTLRGVTAKTASFFGLQAQFECDRFFRDSVDLEVEYLGYKTFRKRYAGPEFRGYKNVQLEVDEQSIAQVVVVGKRIAMVFRGDTTVYNASAFRTMADDRLSELLKQLPGVEIRDDKIYADGQEVKRVYVDGRNLFGKQTSASLTDLEASDVEHVRIYEEQNPEAKRTGDVTAQKEKVMDVETKSKRGVLWGGEVSAMAGASLEKDYSGRHEIRRAEGLQLYRHSERGSMRLEAADSKDETRRENASLSARITPTKRSKAELSHEYRRGDSTSVWTYAEFGRSRQRSAGTTATEYFPTDEYRQFDKRSRSESLSKNLSASIGNMTSIQRRKNTFYADVNLNYENGTTAGQTRNRQLIDGDETFTRTHSDGDDRSIGFNASLNYSMRLSEKSRLILGASFSYSMQDGDSWQVDTTASTPGLRTKLRNDGRGRQYGFGARADYRYQTGEKSFLSAGYGFSRRYNRSEQLSIDFLDDPQGVLDTVNSYNYTVDYYTHDLNLSWSQAAGDFRCQANLRAGLIDLARDERFPEKEHAPRRFFSLAPNVYLVFGKPRRRVSLYLDVSPQVPSAEALRSTLDATNPLYLQAGNPDLKLPANLSGSLRFYASKAETARTLSLGVSGGYGFNYITSRRRLFLEPTYLPEYDYTAQKGAQLTTQVNVGGSYNVGADAGWSQRLSKLQSTVRVGLGYDFRQTPYFLDTRLYRSGSHSLHLTAGFDTGFSTKVKISLGTTTSMSSYTTQQQTRQDLREVVTARVDLRFGKYFGYAGTLYEFYCNSSSKTLTRHNVVLNAAAGRKFGKENRFSVSVGAVDLLNRPDYASTRFETDYVQTRSTSYLGRYAYLQAAYTF